MICVLKIELLSWSEDFAANWRWNWIETHMSPHARDLWAVVCDSVIVPNMRAILDSDFGCHAN
jgi:hypothetical protein